MRVSCPSNGKLAGMVSQAITTNMIDRALVIRFVTNTSRMIIVRELSSFIGSGPSVCDGQSSISSGPQFAYVKKIWSPPLPMQKKSLAPPLFDPKKILVPLWRTEKIGPP